MKKNSKMILAAVGTAVMAAGMLAGCGSSSKETTAAQTTTAADSKAADTTEAKKEEQNVIFGDRRKRKRKIGICGEADSGERITPPDLCGNDDGMGR